MRGFAFGVLDPDGDRYLLAVRHSEACPACRAYVRSLRGLAAVLPPTPVLLHWALAAGSGAGAAAGAGTAAGSGSSLGGAGVAGAPGASGVGAGAISASGAAGAGAAGGGWWLAGGLGAKLAVGCLLALGVSAGCVALDGPSPSKQAHMRRHRDEHPPGRAAASTAARQAFTRARQSSLGAPSGAVVDATSAPSSSTARLTHEFSLERARVQPSPQTASAAGTSRRARAATRSSARQVAATAPERIATSVASRAQSRPAEPASAASAAQREFAPG
jgi:hypothetical protein